jgi:hypothetical protein
MVVGFPGYFIFTPCPSGCTALFIGCPVCSAVGPGACIQHSVAPFYRCNTVREVAVMRDPRTIKDNIRTICGDIIIYISEINKNRPGP